MSFFSEYKEVSELLKDKQQVVFYAESRHYYQYFKKLIDDLQASSDVTITYITSDKQDPLLTYAAPGMKVIYVKWLLGFLFSKIRANVILMTMPDLGNFLFKRSAAVGCYIYIFHAAVSTHQQYSEKAFFNYDAIFCTGEYQENEIRRAEELNGLKRKDLIPYGYPLFDQLKVNAAPTEHKTILVAPSWYKEGIFETCFDELIIQLSKLPYRVIIRSHPEYEKRNKKNFKKIRKLIDSHSDMQLDNSPAVTDRLPQTDILITDRSGIAFEFAFGTGKPVLFIDTPLKINNPKYTWLGIEPIENSLRAELGVSVSSSSLNLIPVKIEELIRSQIGFGQKMEQVKKEIFYNSAETYKAGYDYIIQKIKKD